MLRRAPDRGQPAEEAARYAVYFTPARGSPLERFGASILGYDAHAGEAVPRPGWPDIECRALDAVTAAPRLYGFHGTLKAPFRLAQGCSEGGLGEAVQALAASRPPVPVGRLQPVLLGRFVALVPAAPSAGLGRLAAECVTALDTFRAPLTPVEQERRHSAGLTPQQTMLLDRWGYPYVLEEFRFHMTLTGPLPPEARESWLRRLSCAFEPIADAEVSIDALTLLRQDPGEPFRAVERFRLAGEGLG